MEADRTEEAVATDWSAAEKKKKGITKDDCDLRAATRRSRYNAQMRVKRYAVLFCQLCQTT